MTTATLAAVETTARTRLLAATAALALIQLVHLLDVLRYAEDASFPGVLADPLAAIGIGLEAVAFATLVLRRASARNWVIVASGVVAAGFALQHGIPVELGANNPYFTIEDGNRADWFRWVTVIVLVVLGGWTALTAWRTTTTRSQRARRG